MDLLGPFFPFDLPGSVVRPGEVHELTTLGTVTEGLARLIQGKTTSLDKAVSYQAGLWKGVSDQSYQTRAELEILSNHTEDIISQTKPGLVIELGPGTFEKSRVLLESLNDKEKHILYVAVDIDRSSLEETIPSLNRELSHITCVGLWGTFENALERFQPACGISGCVWSFGSTLSNGPLDAISSRFEDWTRGNYSLVIGQDCTQDEQRIEAAYHSDEFRNLSLAGFNHRLPGMPEGIFEPERWNTDCAIDKDPTCHRFIRTAKEDISENIPKGTAISYFLCYKLTHYDMSVGCKKAGCFIQDSFPDSSNSLEVYIIKRAGTWGWKYLWFMIAAGFRNWIDRWKSLR